MRPATLPRLLGLALIPVLAALSALPAAAELPEPEHVFFGTPLRNGELVLVGEVTVQVGPDTSPLASYILGENPSLGDRFALRVPMGSGPAGPVRTARPGEEARIYLDGELSGLYEIGAPGFVQFLEIDPFFDDDAELSVSDVSVVEGDSGTVTALFEVRLSRPIVGAVSASWATVDGTAIGGSDYVTDSGTLSIDPGDTLATVAIEVQGDVEIEPTETFTLVLSDPTASVLADPEGLGTIETDDTQFALTILDTEVMENDVTGSEAVFTVVVDIEAPTEALPSGPVSVDWTTADGSAIGDVDFASSAGTLTVDTGVICPGPGLPCGEIRISILADQEREAQETFSVILSAPANGAIIDGTGVATIYDDEIVLYFLEAKKEGDACVDCLDGSAAALVTPDGGRLLSAASRSDAITVFARDGEGRLTLESVVRDGDPGVDGLAGVGALALSPDGAHLYAAGFADDLLAVFDVGPGGLSPVETVAGLDRPSAVAVSPEGAHVYVGAGNSVHVYARAGDGTLSSVEVETDGAGGVTGLAGVSSVALSSDGLFLYVTAGVDSALTVFERTPGTGALAPVDLAKDGLGGVDGLDGASAVALSPDGAHAYVTGELDDAVALFRLQPGNPDHLVYVDRWNEQFDGIVGLQGASAVVVDHGGDWVYTVGRSANAIIAFARNAATGTLEPVETRTDGDLDPLGSVDGLEGSLGLALGPETDRRHLYAAGSEDDAVAVFSHDTFAPLPPGLSSPTHGVGVWSGDPVIEVEWSGAIDAGGVGVLGYAVIFDGLPGSDPGTVVNVPEAGDPHQAVSEPRPDGDTWFHLRVCDLSDNCSDPIHFGPFWIDTTPPGAVSGLTSPSHPLGVPLANDDLELVWSEAVDSGSGIDGYGLGIDDQPSAACIQVASLPAGSSSATVSDLPDGEWFAHLCAVDAAGNWGAVQDAGSFVVDLTGPRIGGVGSVADTGDGQIVPGEGVVVALTQLIVAFDEPTVGADLVASYLLVGTGPNGVLDTADCTLIGDDEEVTVLGVTAISGTPEPEEVALVLDAGRGLPQGRYRLLACAVLVDEAGNSLDGNGDGVGGDDFGIEFVVEATNRLENPNFDFGLGDWTIRPGTLADPDDADGATVSGSVVFIGGVGVVPIQTISQCVANLTSSDRLELGGSVKLDSPSPGGPLAAALIDHFADSTCSGEVLSGAATGAVVGSTSGDWVELEPSVFEIPAGAGSSRVFLLSDGLDAANTEVRFDRVYLRDPVLLFLDGFESGDVSGWTSSSP